MASADSGTNTNAGLSSAKRALLLRKLQQRNTIASGNHTIARRTERLTAPLSFVQQQMWFLDQLSPGDIMYNRPAAIRISGALDQKRLQRSLQAIISRHEVLRTTFPSADGIPFQAIHAPSDVLVTRLDMSADPAHTRDKRARERMLSEAQKTFDLASGPLLRAFLIKLSTVEHIVLLCTHHIVFDGWSERILWQELEAHYDALASGAKPTSAGPCHSIWRLCTVATTASAKPIEDGLVKILAAATRGSTDTGPSRRPATTHSPHSRGRS